MKFLHRIKSESTTRVTFTVERDLCCVQWLGGKQLQTAAEINQVLLLNGIITVTIYQPNLCFYLFVHASGLYVPKCSTLVSFDNMTFSQSPSESSTCCVAVSDLTCT